MSAKKMFSVDYAANTLTITAACAEKMNDPNSEEYKAIQQICADFPAMGIVRRTHATPRKYVSKSTGEVFNCNPFKNLKYENMEAFINGLPNNEEYRQAYDFLRNCGSLPLPSRYTAVRRWFTAQFPEFRKNPLFYYYHPAAVISFAPFIEEELSRVEEAQKAS